MRTSRKNQAGFTLVELMIVMAIIGVLLKEDLHVMRSAIDSYTADKQKAPQSLDDLVTDGYLKEIPVDPMTRTKDTWQTTQSDALSSVDQTDPGINDVHSGSQEQGTDGQPYSQW